MSAVLTPWLIRLALAVGFLGAGAGFGYHYADNACKARQGEAQTVAIEQHDEAAAVGQVVEQKSVQRAVKTESVFNGIQLGAITYAQSHSVAVDCRLTDDGLRLWTAANTGADAVPAGERDAVMPGPATTTERSNDGSADQSHRGGQGLSPVPGFAPGTDRLAGGH